ncbi:MAG: DUF5591 domain-containing protein [archaeon]
MEKRIILASGKCSWGKCFACGWGKIESELNIEKLKKYLENLNLKNVDSLKVFASGSFLDDAQFPREFRKWFAKFLKEKRVKKLTIESRPEYITDENLADFEGIELTVAIGLECANDEVLEKYEKGFTVEDFLKAVQTLKKNKCKVRTYLMVNMPFSTPQDLDKSVEFALNYSDSIVLINTFPHSKSKLFELWVKGKWKPYDKEQFFNAVEKWAKNPKIELDFENYVFIPKIPQEKQEKIVGASIKNLEHPYYNIWQDYFQRFYNPPKEKDILLFLPCAYKKPYRESETHKKIRETLKKVPCFPRIHRVVVSNPGVIPFEFSDYYPFNNYDWPEWEETLEIKKAYIETTKERVKKYLEKHSKHYKKMFAFLKYTETWEAISKAAEELGLEIENVLRKETWEKIKEEKNPIIHELALKDLEEKLKKVNA